MGFGGEEVKEMPAQKKKSNKRTDGVANLKDIVDALLDLDKQGNDLILQLLTCGLYQGIVHRKPMRWLCFSEFVTLRINLTKWSMVQVKIIYQYLP